MASSSGNSLDSGSTTRLQNSASEGDLMDIRKRKRMESNRESARRSRMRKQKHLDDLMTQVANLRKENSQILTSINITNHHYLNAATENSVMRVQMMELRQRLRSLDDILCFMDNTKNQPVFDKDYDVQFENNNLDSFMDPWNMVYVNQPIMSSADDFQY